VAGTADAGPAVEDRPTRIDRDQRRDQTQERRQDQQDRGGDEDVEGAQQRVDGPRVPLARGRDEFFEAGLGLGQIAQEGVTG
jgi:hypothetical protein